jgi:ABC-2 type transport system permease protein
MSLAIPEPFPLSIPTAPPDRTAAALRWLRWRQVHNTIRTLLSGSRLRVSMILFCSTVFWAGLFILFLGGFQFIGLYVDLANTLIEYLFSLFFLSLLVMLFFSTGIIVYTTLFHSREAAFLLTTPASTDRIFAYKFAEAVGFSSWGFFLLGSPLMVA